MLALTRLAEAAEDRSAFVDQLRSSEGLRARLLGVLGASSALGDHLVAYPGDWHLLTDDAQGQTRMSADELSRRC